MELTVLRQELAALRAEKAAPPVATLPDSSTLQQWIAGLGAAWRGSPDAQRAEALLRQATQETAKTKATAMQAERRVTELESRCAGIGTDACTTPARAPGGTAHSAYRAGGE